MQRIFQFFSKRYLFYFILVNSIELVAATAAAAEIVSEQEHALSQIRLPSANTPIETKQKCSTYLVGMMKRTNEIILLVFYSCLFLFLHLTIKKVCVCMCVCLSICLNLKMYFNF